MVPFVPSLLLHPVCDFESKVCLLYGWPAEGWGRGGQGVWDWRVHIAIFTVDNDRACCAALRTLPGVTWQPGWEGTFLGGWILMCVWLSPFAVLLKQC